MRTLDWARRARADGHPLPTADPLRFVAYRKRPPNIVPRRFFEHYGPAHRRYRRAGSYLRRDASPAGACWSEFSRNYYRRRHCPPRQRLQPGTWG